jgi:hypothetical protein
MDRKSILTKTAKGLMEATGKTSDLSRDLRNLLKEVDGKVSVGQLQMRQELFTEAKFMDALRALEKQGYVREITPQKDEPIPPVRNPMSKPPTASAGEDLDFTAIASRTGAKSATDITRQIAAERERVEAAAKAKAEETARRHAYESDEKKNREELDSVHREADERARKLTEEKARREAEEKGKRDAEARAKREADERVKREAEERRRREEEERRRGEEEERRRREAEERAKREAEERAKREAAERARREEEERARREAEERRRREEDERRRREEEERAKREVAERARREEEKRRAEEEDERRRKEEDKRRWEIEARAQAAELEEQIRLERAARDEKERSRNEARPEAAELEAALRAERAETEERVRRENEARVRREEEERRRQEEEGRLRPASEGGAEEEITRREEEMRRREQEETARAKQEAKARTEADAQASAQARKEAREREKAIEKDDRRAIEQERARGRAGKGRARRRSGNVARPIAAGAFLVLAIAVAALHFVPIDSASYEKTAEEWLGQPVRIGAVYVALVPSPHLRFERIVIGKDPQLRIPMARAPFGLASLLDERKTVRRIDIEGGTLPQAFLPALLSSGGGRFVGVERVTGKGIKLDIPGFTVPDVDVDAVLDTRGGVTNLRLSNAERRLSATLQPQAGRATFEMAADKLALPIGANLSLEEFSAKGTVGHNEIAFSEFEGRALNGTIQGNGRLRWGDGWTLDGEFSVRQMDAAKIAAPIVAGGKLEGKGVYGMKAAAPDKLFEAARMDGHFTIQKGTITNVDMTRILQGSSTGGGTTLFSEMSGTASADSGRIQVRQLRMAAGLLQGAGSVDVDPEKNLSGRVQIELRAQTVQARATLSVSGNLQNPQFRRTN